MPIRLNLLAEAQANEEMRRRDPVKRAIWVTALLVACMLAWSSWLQLKAVLASSALSGIAVQVSLSTNAYQRVLDNQNKTADIERRLSALQQLVTNRFLYGTALNALQQTTVEDVRLVHFKGEQIYTATEPVKGKSNPDGPPVKEKSATATERIALTLEGVDSSTSPGEQVNRLVEAMSTNAYFRSALSRTNPIILKNISPPQVSPGDGKPSVVFTLECRYPEKTR